MIDLHEIKFGAPESADETLVLTLRLIPFLWGRSCMFISKTNLAAARHQATRPRRL